MRSDPINRFAASLPYHLLRSMISATMIYNLGDISPDAVRSDRSCPAQDLRPCTVTAVASARSDRPSRRRTAADHSATPPPASPPPSPPPPPQPEWRSVSVPPTISANCTYDLGELYLRSRRLLHTISATFTYDLGDFYIRSRLLALFFEPQPVDRFGVPCGHLLLWRHVPE